jgi:hypothetical protein
VAAHSCQLPDMVGPHIVQYIAGPGIGVNHKGTLALLCGLQVLPLLANGAPLGWLRRQQETIRSK